jgi:hypothetical protein
MTLLFALNQCALGCERGVGYFSKAAYSIPRFSRSKEPKIPTGPKPTMATFFLNRV